MKNLFTLLFALVACSLSAQVYFTEDFEGGALPADWSQLTAATDGGFLIGNAATLSGGASPLGAGNVDATGSFFAATNDDACNCDKDDERLVTSAIDLTGVAADIPVVLKFDAWYLDATYGGVMESATLQASIDGGITWEDVSGIAGNGDGWAPRSIDISAYSGTTVQLGFHYSDGGGWLYALAVDNILVTTPADIDVKFGGISMRSAALAGTTVDVGGIIQNEGVQAITSIDVTYSDGTNDYTETLNGLDIASFESGTFTHSTTYDIPAGYNPLTMTISNPNGVVDPNMDDNSGEIETRGVVPAVGRKVVIEEGTGTWCPWCPRGEVFLGIMHDRYPERFIGIAVHNGDPMTVAEYDSGLGISGFPNMSNERTENFGFGVIADVEDRFFDRVEMAPPALVESAATYDAATGDLTVSSQAIITDAVPANHRLAVVLVEDGVTGTSSGYAQTNNYAGGANGPMGGYENLPSTVPASQMVYDHVGRVLVGGFGGDASSLPDGGVAGEEFVHTFATVNIPADYDLDEMNVVTLLLNGSGNIINAEYQTLQEALDNQLVGTNEQFDNSLAKVYPNPFSDVVNIQLNLETAADVNVRVMNAVGQVVATQQYNNVVGNRVIPFNGSNLANGVYTIHMTVGDKLVTKKVMLQK
ncbi:MAG: hypothetical protein ACI9XO_002289 [Paraglaciecola sp.]|jgi:hypothetical protein